MIPNLMDNPTLRVAAVILYMLVVLAVGRALYLFLMRLKRKRTEALRAKALELGFTFQPEGWTDSRDQPLLETPLFGQGWRGQRDLPFTNLMTSSQNGLKISIFDYTYFIGGGKDTRVYRQTVGAFSKAGVHLPYFELRPAGFIDEIWDTLGHKNIHFEADPEFSRRYVLRGALDDKVIAFFTPSLRSFLESLDPHDKWHLEGNADTLVLYRFKQRTPPPELRTFYEQTTSIATSFFDLVTPTAIEHAENPPTPPPNLQMIE